MKTKAIITGVVVLVVLLFIGILLSVHRQPPQPVTVRHVVSLQYGDVTYITVEITNHTADMYIFLRFEVQVRNGNAWTKVPCSISKFIGLVLAPRGVSSCIADVTNLPANCVVRFSIHSEKRLLGLAGLIKRVEFNLKQLGGGRPWISLNPYDKNFRVYGNPTGVISEEWVEPGK
jgi:hypothetical protein